MQTVSKEVTVASDSELLGTIAGGVTGFFSYGGLQGLDETLNISGLHANKPLNIAEDAAWKNEAQEHSCC